MCKLNKKAVDFLQDFNSLEEWKDKFDFLIALGDEMDRIPAQLETEHTRIKNCISRTYFYASLQDDKLTISGSSNAAIPKGLITMLQKSFNSCNKDEIKSITEFINQTELLIHLSPARKAGLSEMIDIIVNLAK